MPLPFIVVVAFTYATWIIDAVRPHRAHVSAAMVSAQVDECVKAELIGAECVDYWRARLALERRDLAARLGGS